MINAASDQVKESKSFAKIVEIVLAMGNELNKATNKPAASAFKVSFLCKVSQSCPACGDKIPVELILYHEW